MDNTLIQLIQHIFDLEIEVAHVKKENAELLAALEQFREGGNPPAGIDMDKLTPPQE